MNLPYIQSELFRELVGIGELLNSECATRISKDIDTSVNFEIYDFSKLATTGKWKRVLFCRVNPRKITTYDQITAEINRIWNEIPAECKRDDILK
jgi:hypothetical protein